MQNDNKQTGNDSSRQRPNETLLQNEVSLQNLEEGNHTSSLKWRLFLALMALVNLSTIVFPILVIFWLSEQAKKGISGTEFIGLLLLPIIITGYLVAFVDVIFIYKYLKTHKTRKSGKIFGWTVVAIAGTYFIVGIFSLVFGVIKTNHEIANFNAKTDARIKHLSIVPPKEITVEEATNLLQNCKLHGLYYTNQNMPFGVKGGENSTTGIILTSVDGVPYRISIADRLIPTLVPIARSAQKTCNEPQFWHDGTYEQYKDGKWYFKGQVVNTTQSGNTKEEAISFMQNCKANYFVGYTDINLIKDESTKAWLNKAEQSTTGIEISEGSPKSYVFASKSMTVALQDTARQFRQSCYNTKKLYITLDNWIETEYPVGTWTKVKQ